MSEAYIVAAGQTSTGRRWATRHRLEVPLNVALGRFDRLSNHQLKELERDLNAELLRRLGNPHLPKVPPGKPGNQGRRDA